MQQRTFHNFFALQIEDSVFIKTIWDPIIIGSFRRQVNNYQFFNKFFVSCELVMYNLPVKCKEIVVRLLLPAFDKVRSMARSNQNDAVHTTLWYKNMQETPVVLFQNIALSWMQLARETTMQQS